MVGGEIHYEDPFSTPEGKREPARRLRGRLAGGVTVWTSGPADARTGLTISSLLLSEGTPSLVVGSISDTTDLYLSIKETGAFVVHLLDDRHKVLSDQFAGLRPSPGGLFAGLEVEDTEWGPLLSSFGNRAFCRLHDDFDSGFQRLVRGTIEKIELDDIDSPLVYFRGRYRALGPREHSSGAEHRSDPPG